MIVLSLLTEVDDFHVVYTQTVGITVPLYNLEMKHALLVLRYSSQG